MLHIFLVILKVIGFLLLGLLGLLLLLCVCVLFWPVNYYIKGCCHDTWELKGTVTFLGIFFRLGVTYKEKLHWKLRILGIPIITDKRKEKKKAGKKQKAVSKLKKDDSEKIQPWEKSFSYIEEKEEKEQEEQRQYKDAQKELDNPEEEGKISAFLSKMRGAVQSFFAGIKKIWQGIKNVAETIKKLPEKMQSIVQRWGAFRDILDDEQARLGIDKGKQEIFLLLKRTKPKKIEGYVLFGFEDPAATGQTLGAIAVVQSIWNPGIRVEPDFERKVFETEFKVKGKVRGSWLLRIGWKALFDKEIKYLTEQFKSLK